MINIDLRTILNIAAIQESSFVDGPGKRFTIWVQGCRLHCPGCINQKFQAIALNQLVPVSILKEKIINAQGIEGVSFSGGEPFEQAVQLARLCQLLTEERPDLTILSFSGFYLSELQQKKDPAIDELLSYLDILIAGPFIESRKASLKWRGSDNQHIHFLSDRYSEDVLSIQSPQEQYDFRADGNIIVNGFEFNDTLKKLNAILKIKGISIDNQTYK